jgi:hypothetical protein
MESTRAWVALVGPASAKKTPEIAAAARPLSKIDAEMYRTYARAKAQWDAMSADQRRSTPRPKQTRIRLEDVTIEAAQEVLQDGPSGVLCDHDELSGWFGSMDKYAMKVVKVVKTNSVILAIRSRRGGREGREGRENSFPLNFVDVEPVPQKNRGKI